MYHKIIGGKKKKKQKNILKSVEYLLREKKPEEQKHIKILSGSKSDIVNFNKYTLNQEKKNPYVCGVLSFEEEMIKDELKIKIISDFEELLFSGIEPENRPPVLWVEHNDKGRVELNYLTFNQLQDKRAYTVYYDKSDRKLVNTYTEIINYENNFSSPFEEKQPEFGSNTLIRKPKTDTPQEKKDFIENINNHILAKIINQELNNREETIEYIKSLENVRINRIRKNQISIKSDYFKDDIPMILKGDIYEEGRNYSDYTKQYTATISRDPRIVKEKLRELTEQFKTGIEERTNKNKNRYKKPQRKDIFKNRQDIKSKSSDLEYINSQSDFKPSSFKSNNFINNDNDYDQNFNEVKENGFNTSKRTIEIEERERRITENQLEFVNSQQQYINSRIEKIRIKQSSTRRRIKKSDDELQLHRKHISRFVQFLSRNTRELRTATKQQFKRYKEKIRYNQEQAQRQEVKRTNNRRAFKPF